MAPLVETSSLTKHYGSIKAVDGLNLKMNPGEVYGFLGPNGSGKSTTILMLLGMTEPTSGTVSVAGHDPTRDPTAVKRQVGYLPEAVGFYPDLTGRRNLLYTAELNGISKPEAEHKVEEVLHMVQLAEAGHRPAGQYSRGMRQRLGLADVLLKEPRLVILDDPTLGLDPAGIQWLLGLIEEMAKQKGIAVFLSSHQLHEVQRICDRVGIMSRGKMVLEGTVNELTAAQESGGYEVYLEVEKSSKPLIKALSEIKSVKNVEANKTKITISGTEDLRHQVSTIVFEQKAGMLELRTSNRSLEEIYLRYFQEPADGED